MRYIKRLYHLTLLLIFLLFLIPINAYAWSIEEFLNLSPQERLDYFFSLSYQERYELLDKLKHDYPHIWGDFLNSIPQFKEEDQILSKDTLTEEDWQRIRELEEEVYGPISDEYWKIMKHLIEEDLRREKPKCDSSLESIN